MRTTAGMLPAALLTLASLSSSVAAGVVGGVEAMTSTVIQRDQSSFSGLGLRVRIHPPQLAEGFSIVPTIEYWRNRSTIRAFDIQSTRKDATLGGFLRYDFRRQGWQPYAGAGVAMHFISDEVDAPQLGLQDASNSLLKGGLLLVGGVSFGLAGNLSNLMELEYHHVPDQSQLKINWGLSWGF